MPSIDLAGYSATSMRTADLRLASTGPLWTKLAAVSITAIAWLLAGAAITFADTRRPSTPR